MKKLILIVMVLHLLSCGGISKKKPLVLAGTPGLKFKLNKTGTGYRVISGNYKTLKVIMIPSTYNGKPVVEIGDDSFSGCTSLKSITIPNSVTNIRQGTFWGCSSLASITIPNSVTSIGMGVFFSCTNLTTITIGNSVESIGQAAFALCSSLTSITIPNSVITIEDGAFSGCSNLTNISIGNRVASIGSQAFDRCTSLKSITIPNSVKSIGQRTFYGCSNLTSIIVDKEKSNYTYIEGVLFSKDKTILVSCPNAKSKSYQIPNSVKVIRAGAFWGCNGLTSISIPNSVKSIGNGAFMLCHNLTSINVDQANSNYTDIEGVLFSKDKTMLVSYPNAKSKSYLIPNSVKVIRDGAFGNCTGLTSITIPNSVTSIEFWAFSHCFNLASITIPNSVTSIGKYAFYGCKSIRIPKGKLKLFRNMIPSNLPSKIVTY